MVIAFGFWRHEEWVRAKNECVNAIRLSYEYANNSTSNSLESLAAARRDEVIAARSLIEIFNAKRLPLSSQDKRDLASATKIVDDFGFDQEQYNLKLGMMNAETADKARQLRKAAYESARKRNLLTQERQSNIEYFFSRQSAR